MIANVGDPESRLDRGAAPSADSFRQRLIVGTFHQFYCDIRSLRHPGGMSG